LGDEIVEIVVGFENNITAAAAVATAGTAFRAIRLAEERHASLTAVSGAGEHFDFVDEHKNKKGRGA
jgi:hypothetical protein